ncbi:MAG: hypothetical protein IKV97_06420 [Clostridia bacterium]|nr:hypothetical protein [Clostridia bacterium]
MLFNVKEYGAAGDGITKDTSAIQDAINEAEKLGGGTVCIPAGKYLCGSVVLMDNITLELLPGAELIASDDPEDYTCAIDFPQSFAEKKDDAFREKRFLGLICCKNVKNVTLRGGRLCANDTAYFEKRNVDKSDFEPAIQAPAWFMYKVAKDRVAMIICENCENITIEDTRIESYPCYASWMIECSDIRVTGVTTAGRKDLINTDGFHFASCRNVFISSCYLHCGDDCIAIDAHEHGESRDVVITNCIFDTSVHAVRVYTGIDSMATGKKRNVKNIMISGCTVKDAAGILSINAQDGIIENVSISNVNATLDAEGTAFLISTQGGEVHNVRISNLSVIGNGCGMIHAESIGDISRVRITDCEYVITPKTKLHAQFDLMPLKFPRHCHFFPICFHFERASDVLVKNVNLTWTAPMYSDRRKPSDIAAFEKRIAPTPLSILEPRHIKAFKLIDCDEVRIVDSVCPDFEC